MYYNSAFERCDLKVGELASCSSSIQCLGQMTCVGNTTCQCAPNEYFDATTLLCQPKLQINTLCTYNWTCRSDLGLYCRHGVCQCDLSTQFWNAVYQKCMDPMTYAQLGCSKDSECQSSQNLFCNLNAASNQCNCPTNSVNGMCDCVRVVSNQNYWDSASKTCKPAATYGQSCVVGMDKSCRTLTELTSCHSSGFCYLKIPGQPCYNTSECEYTRNVSCVNSACTCPNDYYWHTTLRQCGKFY